jgi:4'-phosphopantetheinyl transferase
MGDTTDLAPGEVHVWQGALDVSAKPLERLAATLSPSERDRARRFREEGHRRRFVAGRGMQRDVLARYSRVPPECLTFTTGPAGKPSLEPNPRDLRFNASNAGGRAVIAVTTGREVGIDLEPLRPMPDALELARRFFSPAEIAALTTTPARARDAAFLAAWTRKEAYVKALGGGLGVRLDSFTVSASIGDTTRLSDGGDSATGRAWSVMPLACRDGWVGALAVEGPVGAVRYFAWSPDPS